MQRRRQPSCRNAEFLQSGWFPHGTHRAWIHHFTRDSCWTLCANKGLLDCVEAEYHVHLVHRRRSHRAGGGVRISDGQGLACNEWRREYQHDHCSSLLPACCLKSDCSDLNSRPHLSLHHHLITILSHSTCCTTQRTFETTDWTKFKTEGEQRRPPTISS